MEKVKVYQMNVSEELGTKKGDFFYQVHVKKNKNKINIYILPQGHVRLLLGKYCPLVVLNAALISNCYTSWLF